MRQQVLPADVLDGGLDAIGDIARAQLAVPFLQDIARCIHAHGADSKVHRALVRHRCRAYDPVKFDIARIGNNAIDQVGAELFARVLAADFPRKALREVGAIYGASLDADVLDLDLALTGHTESAFCLGDCNFSRLGVDYDWFCHDFTSYQ